MNAFADWLFGIILGWTRGLANAAWNLVTNHAGGISRWFAAMWLPLLIALLAGGTVIDYIVWLVRWRPQERWRARRAQRLQRQADARYAQDLARADMPEDYRNMMSGWVQEDEATMPLPENLYARPAQPQPVMEAAPHMPQPGAAAAAPELNIAWRPAAGAPAPRDAAPVWTHPTAQHPGYPEEPASAPVRRRRSERRRGVMGALSGVRDALRRGEEDEAPAADSAFREPVYPPAYRYDQPAPREGEERRDG